MNIAKEIINELKVDKSFAENLKLIIIPKEIRERISKELKKVHDLKNSY